MGQLYIDSNRGSKGDPYKKQEPIDTEYTLECPECGYTLFGEEPRIVMMCSSCKDKVFKNNKKEIVWEYLY